MKHEDPSRIVPEVESKHAGKPRKEYAFPLWPRVVVGLVLAVALIVGCGGWAALAKLEGAVVTAGSVKVDQNLKEVQHRDGGTIKTLAVRQGDLVKEGQALSYFRLHQPAVPTLRRPATVESTRGTQQKTARRRSLSQSSELAIPFKTDVVDVERQPASRIVATARAVGDAGVCSASPQQSLG